MMDYKEAMQTLGLIERDMKELHSEYPHDYNFKYASGYFSELRSFIKSRDDQIKSQKDDIAKLVIDVNRLSQLEETCPDCQGKGGLYDAGEGTEDRCETCQGSGKVPICYLPDEVAQYLIKSGRCWVYRKGVKSDIDNSDSLTELPVTSFAFEGKTYKPQPNNLWKLEAI